MTENKVNSNLTETEERSIRCFTPDKQILKYEVGDVITVKGYLKVNSNERGTFFKMDVTDVLPGNIDGLGNSLSDDDETNDPF